MTALFVFVTTCLSSWVTIGNVAVMDYASFIRTQGDLHYIRDALLEYSEERDEYPDSLEQLAALDEFDVALDHPDILLDPWGNPYCYVKTDDGFRLFSLGRDGDSGGFGLDADINVDAAARATLSLPLSQFLFQTAGSAVVWVVALVAGVCAGAASYTSTHSRTDRCPSRTRLLASVAAQMVLTVIVAVVLVALYVMQSQSGH